MSLFNCLATIARREELIVVGPVLAGVHRGPTSTASPGTGSRVVSIAAFGGHGVAVNPRFRS